MCKTPCFSDMPVPMLMRFPSGPESVCQRHSRCIQKIQNNEQKFFFDKENYNTTKGVFGCISFKDDLLRVVALHLIEIDLLFSSNFDGCSEQSGFSKSLYLTSSNCHEYSIHNSDVT